MNAPNPIALRETVEDIVRYRNEALALYRVAFGKVAEADAAEKAAADMASRACGGRVNNYSHDHGRETSAFYNAIKLPDGDLYMKIARKIIDINAWAFIIERTDLERLMDKQAKDELRNQMRYVPEPAKGDRELITGEEIAKGLPELTVENVMATLERFAMDSGTIFRRGIANVFSKLDRRFRSHDGFKIGSRIILTHAFDSFGGLNWGSIRDQLIDVERVFAILDGKPESSFTSALYALDHDRRGGFRPKQSYTEAGYFRIRGFKNGNAHLWFTRDDLVDKVNKILAEWYGEAIGDGQTQEPDPLDDIKTTPAKRYGFFPTPDGAAKEVFDGVWLTQSKDKPPLRILEPSAGTGNLARRCISKPRTVDRDDEWNRRRIEEHNASHRFDNQVDVVEIQPDLARALEAEGIYHRVYCSDFHALKPETTGLYDIVVANPPFDRERDIDHVVHMLDFLKPGGQLVAIMSAGTEFRQTKKAIAFREMMKSKGARIRDLPAGSFSEVGTNVNTIVVSIGGSSYAGHPFDA